MKWWYYQKIFNKWSC